MKEKTTETISVKIRVTNILQNSVVVKTLERLSQSNRFYNFCWYMVWKEPNRRRYENLKNETIQKGGRSQMHYQQRTIISFQPERNFGQLGKYSVQDVSTIAQAGQAALIRCH